MYTAHIKTYWRWCPESQINKATVGLASITFSGSALLVGETPASFLAMEANLSFYPRHLPAGPWNRFSLEVIFIGGFTGQEKVEHMSSSPWSDDLCLLTQILISVSVFALGFLWISWFLIPAFPCFSHFIFSSFFTSCPHSLLSCLDNSYLSVPHRNLIILVGIHWYGSLNCPRGFNSQPPSYFLYMLRVPPLSSNSVFLSRPLDSGNIPHSCSLQPPSLTSIPAIYLILGSQISWSLIFLTLLSSARLTGACWWSQGSLCKVLRMNDTKPCAILNFNSIDICEAPICCWGCSGAQAHPVPSFTELSEQ